ncbi:MULTISPECIES: TrkH family potassium uptake protein [unclassified Haematobacter]|uniref:TrkH family potassium uptake protein n=1 Tax=unclassified Haematobacter TaxID=2640585 RepID=UPI0025C6DE0E|nr:MULTISPECIES: TrkH family potassium uptake protein [unclassified Haematobacter]
MLDVRPVGYIIGLLVAVIGLAMLAPLALEVALRTPHWRPFAEGAIVTVLTGALVALACRGESRQGLTIRQSFLLTTGTWIVLPFFGALPLMIGAPHANLTDAYFEAMSGFTTTGTTVFVGLDDLPRGTNLWRAMMNGMGGLGIVIVAMIFLPVMRVGGMQFFRSEGFDTLGKVLPRAIDIAGALLRLYIVLTVTFIVIFRMLGLSAYDATVMALSSVSTGGFSSYDDSFARFGPGPQWAAVVFMIIASTPFIRYIQLVRGDPTPLWRDVQVRAYLRWLFYAVMLVFLYRTLVSGAPVVQTLQESAFNVVSLFSGTGLTTADASTWGQFPLTVVILAGLVGGCTSSTGCSIKVFRFLILFQAIRSQILRINSPHAMHPVRLEGRVVDSDVLNSVILFFTIFMLSLGVLTLGLSVCGLHFRTAMTAAWTAIANVGTVYGPEVEASGAVAGFPRTAKWLMTFGMLLGRLELIAVFVLLMPRFWRG